MPFYNVNYTFYVPTEDTIRVEANNPTDAEAQALKELESILAKNVERVDLDLIEEVV
jgi:hypothetical protein